MHALSLPQVKVLLRGARKKAGYVDDAFVKIQIRHPGVQSTFFDEKMMRHEYAHDDRIAIFEYDVTKPDEAAAAIFDFSGTGANPVLGSCPGIDISSNGNFYSSLSPFTTWFITVFPLEGVDYSKVTDVQLLMPKMYARSTTTRPEMSRGACSRRLPLPAGHLTHRWPQFQIPPVPVRGT